MLILCTARLELLERRPAWGGGKLNAANVALAPLSADETAKLIAALSDRPLLEAGAQAELLDRAGGNPLYAEQYVRMLAERGTTVDAAGVGAGDHRRAAGWAAAGGEGGCCRTRRCWARCSGSARSVSASSSYTRCSRRSSCSARGAARSPARRSSRSSMSWCATSRTGRSRARERAQKHLRAAEWIESLGRPEDHAEMVAHHYASALELARAAGQDVDDLRRAYAGRIARCRRARADAERARRRRRSISGKRSCSPRPTTPNGPACCCSTAEFVTCGSWRASTSSPRRANRSSAAGDRDGAAEASLMLADIAWQGGSRDGMLQELEAARRLVDGGIAIPHPGRGDRRGGALRDARRSAGRSARARPRGPRARRGARPGGSPRARAQHHRCCASATWAIAVGSTTWRRASRSRRAGNFVSDLLRGHNNRQALYFLYGEIGEGPSGRGSHAGAGPPLRSAGVRAFRRGRALRWGTATWQVSGTTRLHVPKRSSLRPKQGTRFYQTGAIYCFRGLIRLARGDDGGAESDAERAIEHARENRDPQALHPDLSMAALLFQSAGNEQRADETLSEALEGLRELHRFGFAANDLPSLAWVAVMRGREPELIELVERESFVSPWLRATAAVLAHDFRGGGGDLRRDGESGARRVLPAARRGAAGGGGPTRGGRRAAPARARVLPVGRGDAVRARGRGAARRQCLAACAAS